MRRYRRAGLYTLFAAMTAFAVGAVGVRSAEASQTCTIKSCYTLVYQGPVAGNNFFDGLEAYIEAPCLTSSNTSIYFASAEAWLQTADNSRWIEAGQAYGAPVGSRRFFFWATNHTTNGYLEHDDTTDVPSASTTYDTFIDGTPPNYTVLSGPFTGTATNWPTGTVFSSIVTGGEAGTQYQEPSYNHTATIHAGSKQLAYWGESNNYHTGWSWGGADPQLQSTPSSWGFENTVTTDSDYWYGTDTSC